MTSSENTSRIITLTYTNWRGETAERRIVPGRFWFGATEWHPEPQWLLTAFDMEKRERRDFALTGFGAAPTMASELVALMEEVARLRAERAVLLRHVNAAQEAISLDDYAAAAFFAELIHAALANGEGR